MSSSLFQILESAAVSQQVKMDPLRAATIGDFWNIVSQRIEEKKL